MTYDGIVSLMLSGRARLEDGTLSSVAPVYPL